MAFDRTQQTRTHLGSNVTIDVTSSKPDINELSEIIDHTFKIIAAYEHIFNFDDPSSCLSRFNKSARIRDMKKDGRLSELLKLALDMAEQSKLAFCPWRGKKVDLSGIVNGYILDKAAARLASDLPEATGSISTGSQVKFFGVRPKEMTFASSATVKRPDFTVVTCADSCAVADAMTKVVIFGRHDTIAACSNCFAADAFVYKTNGELVKQIRNSGKQAG